MITLMEIYDKKNIQTADGYKEAIQKMKDYSAMESYTQADYDSEIDEISLSDLVCPSCGKKGCLHRYAKYARHLVHKGHDERIEIVRTRCGNCGRTHALLTAIMLPYHVFSVPFFLSALDLAARLGMRICHIARKLDTSYQHLQSLIISFRKDHEANLRRIASPDEPIDVLIMLRYIQEYHMMLLERRLAPGVTHGFHLIT